MFQCLMVADLFSKINVQKSCGIKTSKVVNFLRDNSISEKNSGRGKSTFLTKFGKTQLKGKKFTVNSTML